MFLLVGIISTSDGILFGSGLGLSLLFYYIYLSTAESLLYEALSFWGAVINASVEN